MSAPTASSSLDTFLRRLQRHLLLRFDTDEAESGYLRHLASEHRVGSFLACLVFFWPWSIWEAVTLDAELRGGPLAWTRIAHYSAVAALTAGASLLTLVTALTCCSLSKKLDCGYFELMWVLLAGVALISCGSSRQHEDLLEGQTASQEFWVLTLAAVVLCCLPVRCQLSWLVMVASMLVPAIGWRSTWQNLAMLGGILVCIGRLAWLSEKAHRQGWHEEPPKYADAVVPLPVQRMLSSESSTREGGGKRSMIMDENLFRKAVSSKSLAAAHQKHRHLSSDSKRGIPGLVEQRSSNNSQLSGTEDVFRAASNRSENLKWVILPLNEDFSVKEVPLEVRLQVGYDITGKHVSCILEQGRDFDFQEQFACMEVKVVLASGPKTATLCLLRTGLEEPAYLALIHSMGEARAAKPWQLPPAGSSLSLSSDPFAREEPKQGPGEASSGRRRSSPAIIGTAKAEVPSLRNLQKRLQKQTSGFSASEKVASVSSGMSPPSCIYNRMRSAGSGLITGSLNYSVDSSLPAHANFADVDVEYAETGIQTAPTGVDASAQTLQIGEVRCRKCARPPRPGSKKRRPRLESTGSEMSPEANMASYAEVLLLTIQGTWELHAGPEDTAPWLQTFTINGYVAESQDDFVEIMIEGSKVFMAGGELHVDDDGLLHRFGKSGSHLVYVRAEEPVFESASLA